jgi:membrane-associated protein
VSAGSRGSLLLLGTLGALLVAGLWLAGPERIAQFFRLIRHHDVRGLVEWGGYVVLGVIVFAETGLLVGFFLPGDSLLVTAGVFSAPGETKILALGALLALLVPLAIVGDAVNYVMGLRTGAAIYERPDGRFFKKAYLLRTQEFYERHGGKTIIIARFIPIIRTFAPFVAGMGKMSYRRFAAYNVVGACLWVLSMTGAGYLMAIAVPDIERYLHLVIAAVIVLSFVPGVLEIWRQRRKAKEKPTPAA